MIVAASAIAFRAQAAALATRADELAGGAEAVGGGFWSAREMERLFTRKGGGGGFMLDELLRAKQRGGRGIGYLGQRRGSSCGGLG